MNQLANIVDRIDSFHLSPVMVAASQAHAALQAATRAFQAVRDAAAADLAALRDELQALQDADVERRIGLRPGAVSDADDQAHDHRVRSLGIAIAELQSACEALQQADQREDTGEAVLTLLSSSADALRDLG